MYLCPVFRKPSNSIWYRNLRNLLSLTVATFSKEKIFVTFYMTREKKQNNTKQGPSRTGTALQEICTATAQSAAFLSVIAVGEY